MPHAADFFSHGQQVNRLKLFKKPRDGLVNDSVFFEVKTTRGKDVADIRECFPVKHQRPQNSLFERQCLGGNLPKDIIRKARNFVCGATSPVLRVCTRLRARFVTWCGVTVAVDHL